jgi:hypothetical protein
LRPGEAGELEDENGELLPDRKAMSILDSGGGVAGAPGKLGPPVLDELVSPDDPEPV